MKFFNFLAQKTKTLLCIIAIYFSFLIIYDILFFKRPLKIMVFTYLFTLLAGLFVWFGVKIVFTILIKNKSCPKAFIDTFVFISFLVFLISSICLGVTFFSEGFLIMTFLAPVALLSLIKVQSFRLKN